MHQQDMEKLAAVIVEVALWFATIVIGLWWLNDSTQPYEPLLVLLGALSVAVSVFRATRRSQLRKTRQTAVPMIHDHTIFLRAITRRDVRYLIVGGFAALLNGEVSSTGDLDVWIDGNEQNQERLRRALADMNIAAPRPFPAMLRVGDRPIDMYIGDGLGRRDFEVCYQRARTQTINGMTLHLIAPQDNLRTRRGA